MSRTSGLGHLVVPGARMAVLAVALVAATQAGAQCGNGTVNAGEQCDQGAANGTPGSCCSATCQFKASGTVCRAAANACDLAESCSGASAACPANAVKPNGSSCSDGQFCNGAETCQAGTCTAGSNPCPMVFCSEALNACLASGCPAGPVVGCKTAEKSILLIKNKVGDDTKDKLIWKWIKGASLTLDQLSDPTSTANYALCVFSPISVVQIDVMPDAIKWAATGTKGYKYADDAAVEDGARKIILKSSDNGTSKALVLAAGANLDDPMDVAALVPPVTVQLINHRSGVCLVSTFTTTLSDTTALFKAKSP